MIMSQAEAEVFDETVPFTTDVCQPQILTISEGIPSRFLFVHVDRP
jgi:hypothetical protein